MTHDAPPNATITRLLNEYGISETTTLLRDELLIVGLRQSFPNLITPGSDGGPMDHPTKALVLAGGPKCEAVHAGDVVFFAKFSAVEIDYLGRRMFIVKEADVRMVQGVSEEYADELAKNVY